MGGKEYPENQGRAQPVVTKHRADFWSFLFLAPTRLWKGTAHRWCLCPMSGKPRSEHRKILRDPVFSFLLGDSPGSLLAPPLGGFGHGKQQVKHLLCPGRLFLLNYVETITQEMGSAQAMSARVGIVADPPIVHRSANEPWPDPNGFERLPSSFAMPRIERQPSGGIDMHLMQKSFDAYSRFIGMLKRARDEQRLDALDGRF